MKAPFQSKKSVQYYLPTTNLQLGGLKVGT